MRVGICGYPGSGKTTVFNALAPGASATQKGGVSLGNIKVPDPRIERLAGVFKPKKTTFAEITFMDVGGGGRADTGAFPPEVVQHMRNCDVVAHVVRVFENPLLEQGVDPARDEQLFNDELLLLDLSILERREERFKKENRKGREVEVNQRAVAHLNTGAPLRTLDLDEDDRATFVGIQLMTLRPLITVYNLSEAAWANPAYAALREVREPAPNTLSMGLCGSVEAEVATLDPEDQGAFLSELGMERPARDAFVQNAYRLLDLISFLTAGSDECRAWPIHRGTVARKAAGKVHSDIERGFIRAEIYKWDELLSAGSEAALKAAGKMRLEGKEYVMQDGDVVNFRFNV